MVSGQINNDQLRLFVERIERLLDDKKGVVDDIRDVYAEMKAQGYDTKTTREIIKLRAMETHDRQERHELIRIYGEQLGLAF